MQGYDAVVLAGGLARRMGGRDKPGLVVAGRSLIEWVADAVAGAERLIVVGPPRPELPHAVVVREQPPGSGPVPALRAGMAEVRAGQVAVLAADLPFLRPEHVGKLCAAAADNEAGALLVDDTGQAQWLCGVWSSGVLRRALGGYQGSSMRGLLAPLGAAEVGFPAGQRPPWHDCDTMTDLEVLSTNRPAAT